MLKAVSDYVPGLSFLVILSTVFKNERLTSIATT